jgi:predicted nucleic-acid-binding protein
VPVTVMPELEWVLRSRYRFSKPEVIAAMELLMESVELIFESEHALSQAIAEYEDNNVDFTDCLHVALAVRANESPLPTFDRAPAKLTGAQAL